MARILLAIVLVATAPAALAQQTIRAEVNGMVCAFCAQGIEKKVRALGATREVYVDLNRKVVAVAPREGAALTTDQVAAAIREAGYEVRAIAETADSIQQIRAGARR